MQLDFIILTSVVIDTGSVIQQNLSSSRNSDRLRDTLEQIQYYIKCNVLYY